MGGLSVEVERPSEKKKEEDEKVCAYAYVAGVPFDNTTTRAILSYAPGLGRK